MSGASMKQIKTRIKSVESTRQITKAMELVATSKLRRAKERAEASRPYRQVMERAIAGLHSVDTDSPSVYVIGREVQRTCYIVIAGDRGLAGGYNANLFRMIRTQLREGDCVLPIGKKALEYYSRSGCELLSDFFAVTATVGTGDCAQISDLLCEGFSQGRFDRVVVAYTYFQSMLSQVPRTHQLLPVAVGEEKEEYSDFLLDGDPTELINRIVPQYVSGVLYTCLCEAMASEHGSRRTAINSANKNASEIIDTLVLKYNRARQAVITQEITEIVSGAEAL
jgi:F-type H+-transporting ATPase subunit gamma